MEWSDAGTPPSEMLPASPFCQESVTPVVPMSIPVSVYGYLGLLRSSLGKEMAHAEIATLSQWMVSN